MNLAREITDLSWRKCFWCPIELINTEIASQGYEYLISWIILISHRRHHGLVFGARYRMLIRARPQFTVKTCGRHVHVAHWVSRVSIESRLRRAEMYTPFFVFLEVLVVAREGVWGLLSRSLLLLHFVQQECLGL